MTTHKSPDWRTRAWGRLRPHIIGPGITRGAAYSVVFLFAVSFLLAAGAYFLATSSIHRAEHNAVTITQLCQAGNTARAQQVRLWGFVIGLSQAHPPPGQTPAGKRQQAQKITAFEAYLHHVFAPRNCNHPSQTEAPGG